jgi:hypothetical protein
MAKSLLERLMTKCKIDWNTDCWNWTAYKMKSGYGTINLDGKPKYAHRVSYEFFKEQDPSGLCVCHHCDNPSCINPEHLFLGTNADNAADRNSKGRQTKGTSHPACKLTEAQVLEIRASAATQKSLASKYGVAQSQISKIKSRKLWPHI